MYTRILVPLDGSRLSESVLPSACSVATSFGIPLELMHVVTPETIDAHLQSKGKQGDGDRIKSDLVTHLKQYLEDLSKKLQISSKIESQVYVGNPVDTIVAEADAKDGTLLAMATRGRSGVKRWLLGSVAEEILHVTNSPLLLFKTTEEFPVDQRTAFKRLLVPLDGSQLAEAILPHVAAVARAMNLDVELIRVFSLPSTAVLPAGAGATAGDYEIVESEKFLEILKEEAEKYLEATKVDLEAKGVDKVSCLALQGSAAEQIIETAVRTEDNLIAMSTHGRSGLKRQVLGSITARVVRHAGDPVLVVRPPMG